MIKISRSWLPILQAECPSLEWTKTYKMKTKKKRGKLYVAETKAVIPILRKYGIIE